jgi:hypothetical protein
VEATEVLSHKLTICETWTALITPGAVAALEEAMARGAAKREGPIGHSFLDSTLGVCQYFAGINSSSAPHPKATPASLGRASATCRTDNKDSLPLKNATHCTIVHHGLLLAM